MTLFLDQIPLPPAVPFAVTSYIVGPRARRSALTSSTLPLLYPPSPAPSAARFFGLDPAKLMPLKERRRYRKNVTRTRRGVRALNRLISGRHDRCMRDVLQAPR